MYSTIIAATSTDGFIAGPGGDQSWLCAEDQAHMRSVIAAHDILVMGSGTFLAHKDFFNAKSTKVRIVLTSNPAAYAQYGHLATFVNTPLAKLVKKYQKTDKKLLIMGGTRLYTDCAAQHIGDALLLTVEPVTLSAGLPLLTAGTVQDLTKQYARTSSQPLNSTGTMLHTYSRY
jgi:dihydrofolate reductase